MEVTQLYSILINHQKWLHKERGGVRADLSGTDLIRVDLSGENLSRADLSGAYLNGADLSGADLSGANFSCANLVDSNLCEVDLSRADLSGADLIGASFSNSNLTGADLSGADLTGAYFVGANLTGVNFIGADFTGADFAGATGIPKQILNKRYPLVCPEEGSFVGWKKVRGDLIVKLKITEGAKRSSAFGRKCRCSEAFVLAIENIDGTPSGFDLAFSIYDAYFAYKVGKVVTVSDFNDDRFVECGAGIHFFITREEAINY